MNISYILTDCKYSLHFNHSKILIINSLYHRTSSKKQYVQFVRLSIVHSNGMCALTSFVCSTLLSCAIDNFPHLMHNILFSLYTIGIILLINIFSNNFEITDSKDIRCLPGLRIVITSATFHCVGTFCKRNIALNKHVILPMGFLGNSLNICPFMR